MNLNLGRPRPVLTSAGIAGLITSIVGVLSFLGYSNAATSLSGSANALTSVAIVAVALGSHLLAGLHGQARVTPVAQPQDHDGMPLVRADSAAAVLTDVVEAPHPSPSPAAALSPAVDVVDVSGDGMAAAAAIDAQPVPVAAPAAVAAAAPGV